MVHSSHHHQSCNQDCWSHHCNTHLQLMDLQHCAHQHQTGDTYIVNIDFLQHMVRNNHHHHNCILGCLLHHYRTRRQSNVHLNKLEFKRYIAFICHKEIHSRFFMYHKLEFRIQIGKKYWDLETCRKS